MSDTFDDIVDVALLVAEAIESCGGAYFVGCSLASSVDGEPRATNDIDFVVDLPMGRVSDLRLALGDDFELDLDMLRDASEPCVTPDAERRATASFRHQRPGGGPVIVRTSRWSGSFRGRAG